MGSILIHKIKYSGDNYSFESPTLTAGLNIIEGPNGAGKSTLMNFIYYALSGKVEEFSKSNKETHFEIVHDSNNYVELDLSIDNDQYQLKRFIDSNDITVLGNHGEVLVFPINRSKNEKRVFSDWILEKLGIEVVEVFQGVNSFKINIKDLLRLIYHNQELNPRKIYKPEDSDNILADSEVVRKIIFELLLGKTFLEYYSTLSKFKEAEKNRNIAKGLLDEYVNIARTLAQNKENLNLVFLGSQRQAKTDQLQKLNLYRNSLKVERPKSTIGLVEIKIVRTVIQDNELKLLDIKRKLTEIVDELLKLERLKDNIILEVTQIKKIIHSHERLNLFSADTCPYCLRNVDRQTGHCVCGAAIDENEYERFFYNSDEYLDILKSKQKSVETVNIAIEACRVEKEKYTNDIRDIDEETEAARERIKELTRNLDDNTDVSKLNEVDDQILITRGELNTIDQTIEIEKKREALDAKFNLSNLEVDVLRNRLKVLEVQANEEIREKVTKFSEFYNSFMTRTLKQCRSARIDSDDYMPVINDGSYREASSSVTIRLMYFLTLLQMSLEYPDVKFPRVLFVDTPETAGVDQENLFNSISQIPSILVKYPNMPCQVILTTGVKKYPDELKANVVLTLADEKRLLKRRES